MPLWDLIVDIVLSPIQVSQYTFAMCSYREKKPDPTEMMQLDGFTVDYCEQIPGLSPVLQHTELDLLTV